MLNQTVSRNVLAATAMVLTGGGQLACAQNAVRPDAGALMQQIEQGQELQLPKLQKPSVVPVPEMKPQPGMTLTVTRFRFAGNTRFDEAVLQKAVEPWLNRPLGFDELQKAAAAVAAVYRDAGWVVRAYLPKQEIENGVVTIQVIEAVFGNVVVDPATDLRFSQDFAKKIVLTAQPAGQPLSGEAIDRALLIIDDLPGVMAQGLLREGKNNGETDLLLKLDNKPYVSGQASLDNTGSRSTGPVRLNGVVFGNSLLGVGDQASGNVLHTEGSDYGRLAWSIPVGYSGLKAGASYSRLGYRVITEEFASQHLDGHSGSAGIDASYPLIRSRGRNLYVSFNYDHKTYLNRANSLNLSDYSINVGSLNLSGNLFDELGGGGSTSGSLTLVKGKVNLDGSPNQSTDARGPHTAGGYQVIRYSLRRNQTLVGKLSLFASVSGQMASKNLDSSEKFYLGGANAVRAYPASEAGGSDGNLLNLELNYLLPYGLTASAFYDYGRVQVNHDNNISGAATNNNLSLKGAGLGLAWMAPFGANFKLTWARRIGTNPNPTPLTGNDQDGSLVLNRVWFQANLPF